MLIEFALTLNLQRSRKYPVDAVESEDARCLEVPPGRYGDSILHNSAKDLVSPWEVPKPGIVSDSSDNSLDDTPLKDLPRCAYSVGGNGVRLEILTNRGRSTEQGKKSRTTLAFANAWYQSNTESIGYGIESKRVNRSFTCGICFIEQCQRWKWHLIELQSQNAIRGSILRYIA